MTPKVLVTIPTYNERENISSLIQSLFELPVPGLEVLVIDDSSPDGTVQAVKELKPLYPGLHLIVRELPAGRGLAGRDGFLYALESGADFIVEMDGDFSHQPKHIPELLAALKNCDMAIGSRLAAGGSDRDRPLLRRILTWAANRYARRVLGLPVSDTNSGFRCYTRKALERINPESLRSSGPSIVHEVLFRAAKAGLKIREVPIEFIDRKKGKSKLSLLRLAAGYFWILRLKARL